MTRVGKSVPSARLDAARLVRRPDEGATVSCVVSIALALALAFRPRARGGICKEGAKASYCYCSRAKKKIDTAQICKIKSQFVHLPRLFEFIVRVVERFVVEQPRIGGIDVIRLARLTPTLVTRAAHLSAGRIHQLLAVPTVATRSQLHRTRTDRVTTNMNSHTDIEFDCWGWRKQMAWVLPFS